MAEQVCLLMGRLADAWPRYTMQIGGERRPKGREIFFYVYIFVKYDYFFIKLYFIFLKPTDFNGGLFFLH